MSLLFHDYAGTPRAFDEVVGAEGVRVAYSSVLRQLAKLDGDEVRARAEYLKSTYLDQGVTFDIGGEERPFPLDILPRVILAEEWADDPEARKSHRALVRAEGVVVTSAREEYAGRKSKYEIYYLFRESIQAIPSHRALAVIRGEREKVLKIELAFPKKPALRNLVVRFIRHPKSAAAP